MRTDNIYKYWQAWLYSNSLYGIAAVLLAVEAGLQMHLQPLPFSFYLLLGAGTIAFYTFSYQYDRQPQAGNRRAAWIAQHAGSLFRWQWILCGGAVLAAGVTYKGLPAITGALWWQLVLGMSVFPCLAMLYYGISFPGVLHLRLRQIGWLKPFTISTVWVGCTAIVPLLLSGWHLQQWPVITLPQLGFMLHSLMYIAVLCILFDIKDYAADHNQQLKTFVVQVGFRATLYRIVLPLVIIGILCLGFFLWGNNYSPAGIILNLLPMLLLAWVTLLLHKNRSIDFYLLLIDGLMPIKAICGIAAVILHRAY